jgi:DNA-binding NarL/FixJ family response regulator
MAIKSGVIIADGHGFFRSTLRRYLEGNKELRVLGETCSGMEAVSLSEKLSPRFVVMDIDLGPIDGIRACRAIKESRPETVVVLYSTDELGMFSDDDKSVADKCIEKERLFEELSSVLDELRGTP